jgi:rod shape-determining protein MreD
LTEGISLIIRLSTGDDFPGWTMLLSPFIETLLWPVANFILLAPQRRAHDPDANRPI